jgi:hypothetical protein
MNRCGGYEALRNGYVLVGKREAKIPQEIPGRKMEDNIKMDLSEIRRRCGLD